MTLAHELVTRLCTRALAWPAAALAIFVTHQSPPTSLRSTTSRVFAAALLIRANSAERLNSEEEVSVEFGVSLEAARIYLDQRRATFARTEYGHRMRRFANELSEAVSPSKKGVHFLDASASYVTKEHCSPLVIRLCAALAIRYLIAFKTEIRLSTEVQV